MNYKLINDYELFYLIEEGSERAYLLLFEKYESLLGKLLRDKYLFLGDKFEDAMQELRIILFNCIKQYNPDGDASFYTYLMISVKRKILKLNDSDYYSNIILLEEESMVADYYLNSLNKILEDGSNILTDDLDIKLYNECIMGNVSIRRFASKNDLKSSYCYYRYDLLIANLKKLLTIMK